VALFCNVDLESVIESINVSTIYEVPLRMQKENLDATVIKKLGITGTESPDIKPWRDLVDRIKNPKEKVDIGLVGKYVELADSYKSINESLVHAGAVFRTRVNMHFIHSEELEEHGVEDLLKDMKGLIVAPGFGERGIEGKIMAARYARENKIPYLGICLGMQCAVIEFARNVLGLKKAHSTEMNPKTPHPVIDLMEDQKGVSEKGGTMRLGAYTCALGEGTLAHQAYQEPFIRERHRHRYEFNNDYLQGFHENGMIAAGINPESDLVEIMELKDHPWFIGIQFHPEYSSTAMNSHPLFKSFVKAALKEKGVDVPSKPKSGQKVE